MEPQCTHLHREYKPVHNVNAIRQHLECKSQQSTFGMQTHTMRKPLLCTSKQCTSSVWLPREFRGLVGATCRARAGCGDLVVAASRPAAQPNFFRWMLLAMSWLLTSNGQRPNCCSGCCVGLLFCLPHKRRLLCNNGGRVAAAFLRRALANFFAVCCSQCFSHLLPMASG